MRCLAAETLGFLLRQASAKQLRVGLRALLGEAAVKPSAERAHGAGLLVAEAVLGVEHGLHSRAPGLVQLLLQEDLLQPEDFGAGAAGAAAGEAEGAPAKKAKRVPKGTMQAFTIATQAFMIGHVLVRLRGQRWVLLICDTEFACHPVWAWSYT